MSDIFAQAMQERSHEVTLLLKRYSAGDEQALSLLVPHVYDELRRLASSYLRGERANHTLQTTALVHEAYLRLVDQRQVQWNNRNHFFAVAAKMMRRILVDHARKRVSLKRGGSLTRISLEDAAVSLLDRPQELVILDELLERLAAFDAKASRIVELRFFVGMSVEETAEIMGVSSAMVRREWSVTKAWLTREFGKAAANVG